MLYRVKVSRAAVADAESAYVWMKLNYSERQATKWFNGLVDAVNSLEEFPTRCPKAPESQELGLELRHLLYGKASACYRLVFAFLSRRALSKSTAFGMVLAIG